ncbi:MAG: hypothetical protein QOE16_398 [Microbacteriaceae bacterium]|nr:hypothetical protein [Microbacteriaceae bacterium]
MCLHDERPIRGVNCEIRAGFRPFARDERIKLPLPVVPVRIKCSCVAREGTSLACSVIRRQPQSEVGQSRIVSAQRAASLDDERRARVDHVPLCRDIRGPVVTPPARCVSCSSWPQELIADVHACGIQTTPPWVDIIHAH